MKISPARKAAFEILNRIEIDSAYSSALLPFFEKNLSDKDSALCHKLVLGVLRKRIYLDRSISFFTGKNTDKFDAEVLNSLRIGLFQIFFLDKVPAYSSINESVNLTKYARKRSASGLVNAVLRRASKEKPDLNLKSNLERLSVESSHPEWLLHRWGEQFGIGMAAKIATANNQEPAKTFRVTKKFEDSPELFKADFYEYLASKDAGVEKFEYAEDCFIARRMTEKIRQFLDLGLIYFQDPASQIVADMVNILNGHYFIDICASPGSKASRILARTRSKDTTTIFGDLHRGRLRVLRDNLKAQGNDNPPIVRYDAQKSLPFKERFFDTVLVDAPCSGTGTIRHNPELRYSLQKSDFYELSNKQLSILINASKLVKAGGYLIYSTCSIENIENECVVDKFLLDNPKFSKSSEAHVSPDFLTKDGYFRTNRFSDNMDGFFIGVLHRDA